MLGHFPIRHEPKNDYQIEKLFFNKCSLLVPRLDHFTHPVWGPLFGLGLFWELVWDMFGSLWNTTHAQINNYQAISKTSQISLETLISHKDFLGVICSPQKRPELVHKPTILLKATQQKMKNHVKLPKNPLENSPQNAPQKAAPQKIQNIPKNYQEQPFLKLFIAKKDPNYQNSQK